jgi:hypothetical protein
MEATTYRYHGNILKIVIHINIFIIFLLNIGHSMSDPGLSYRSRDEV